MIPFVTHQMMISELLSSFIFIMNYYKNDTNKQPPKTYSDLFKLPEAKYKNNKVDLERVKYRIDMRPKTFFSKMKKEIFLLFFGISIALSK